MALEGWTQAGRRVGVTPAEAAALVALLLASACLTLLVWQRSSPTAGAATAPTPDVRITSAPPATEVAVVVVDVAGLVARPGVVELPAGSRVADAIRAAGGLRSPASTSHLNLARPLTDGERIVVTDGTTPAPETVTSAPSAFDAQGRLDLNAATADDLESLPGVGPVTAERILAHREDIGGYSDVVQLLEVPGIGPTRYASLEPLVTV